MCGVGVVEPEVVLRAGQGPGELDVLADLAGRDGGVRLGEAKGRTVVDPVEGVVIAAHVREVDHQIGGVTGLEVEVDGWYQG